MRLAQKLSVVTLGIVLSFSVVNTKSAYAVNLVRRDFTVNINNTADNGGPLAGNSYTGSATYDADVLASNVDPGFGNSAPILGFSFDFPGFNQVFKFNELPYPEAKLTDSGEFFLDIFNAPPPVGSTAFLFGSVQTGGAPLPVNTFIYGKTTNEWTGFRNEGSGKVAYSAATPVPDRANASYLLIKSK